MRKGSLIDDVSLDGWENEGPPILFTNPEVRRMLNLARMSPRDVFYDLGSGWGQNLVVALTEYQVRKAVGIESDKKRYDLSLKRLEGLWKCGISRDRWVLVNDKFEKILARRMKGLDTTEATILFYGLSTDRWIFNSIKRAMMKGARIVYYYNCLFPEIMPDRVDFPFYVSVAPFRGPRSEREWLLSVVQKKSSSVVSGKELSSLELWDELSHDYDVERIGDPVHEYRARLERAVAGNT